MAGTFNRLLATPRHCPARGNSQVGHLAEIRTTLAQTMPGAARMLAAWILVLVLGLVSFAGVAGALGIFSATSSAVAVSFAASTAIATTSKWVCNACR